MNAMNVDGPEGARVGLVQFNETASLTFPLSRFQDSTSLLEAIKSMPLYGGGTNITAVRAKIKSASIKFINLKIQKLCKEFLQLEVKCSNVKTSVN